MSSEKYIKQLGSYPFKATALIRNTRGPKQFARVCLIIFAIILFSLFLPWTQNIRSQGNMTAYLPQDRPQTVQSVIAGQITKWYIREGQHVMKGDTIAELTEIREKFFDPKLLERIREQINAKESSQTSSVNKVAALGNQVKALLRERQLSIEKARNKVLQAELKIQSDSADYNAIETDLEIARVQNRRADSLYKKGLIALNELERRNLKAQESFAKRVSIQNKLLTSRNELVNAKIELNSLDAEYATKISKAESELNSALAYLYETEGEIAKMNNEFANISIRSGFYFITAPQDGFVVQARISGVGETVKEGDAICTIMPSNSNLAVELYVRPMDIPLLEKGRKTRIQFDGWPALVFSGWPNYTFGTFGGIVAVIDNIDTRGHYRILVIPDPDDDPWPHQLRVGSGAYGWIMLQDVPIWYELWRQFNGFPPDYMGSAIDDKSKSKVKTKANSESHKDSEK